MLAKSEGSAAVTRYVCGVPGLPEYRHAYTITPFNFLILPEEKQRRKLGDFFDLLRMLQHTSTITLERVPITVQMGGGVSSQNKTDDAVRPVKKSPAQPSAQMTATEQTMEITQVLLDTPDALDDTLESLGYSYTIDEPPHPGPRVTAEGVRDFRCLINGMHLYARAYTVYGAPTMLPPAWVYRVFRTFHRLQIHITPMRPDDAMRKMTTREVLYSGVKTSKANLQKKLQDIRVLKRDLELGNTSAFTFVINGFVFARTRKELTELGRQVRRNCSAMNVRITSSYGRQKHMAQMGAGAGWMGAIHSMHILYPFASADMLEAPGGIMLGRNQDTGGPVIYDVNRRKNHNVFTCGTTGAGKSFTNKIILKRFTERRPNTMCVVIDPQGEYLPYADYFGLDGIEIEAGHQYGLDPFAMFDTPVEAADLLGAATNAPNEVRREWRSKCDGIKSVRELYEASTEGARRYLADLVQGSISKVFEGMPRFSDRMIISLKKTDGQEYEGMLILLVLAYAWRRVNELPPGQWKFILLDEAWRMTKIQQSIKKIGEMARQGRKRSLIFAVSTQQFSDMDRALDDESKLTELFDTKMIMQLSQSAAKSAGRALDLTDREVERITNFRPGTGLLQTSANSVYLKFEATADETKRYFNTKEEKI